MKKIACGVMQKLIMDIAVVSIGILAIPVCLFLGIIVAVLRNSEYVKGVENFVRMISLCIQGLTSADKDEIIKWVQTLTRIDTGANLMHEGVAAENHESFTHPWFDWANSIFSEFVNKRPSNLCN